MSTLAYNEPYKLPAAFWTLVVHCIFFAALYWSVNWHEQQPEGMTVDLWSVLPEGNSAPAHSAQQAEMKAELAQKVETTKQQAILKPALPPKADIVLAEKKKKTEIKAREVVKPAPRKRLTKAEQRSLAEMEALGNPGELADQQNAAKRAAQATAAAAAITSEVGKYKGLISSKIRRSIVMPPDVADNALAVFVVTLIPDGSVLEVKLRKSSGNAAYDDAVARAISKAQPLPLPPDETVRNLFINPNQLQLKFSPKDGD